ncbi:hypothetical protein GW819_01150 [Candidatus Gracilibacteria bacterium]|nr:hypothetical protein [Candidatus Gracilibacteria bacterium]OIO78191.1 MAG: hypothetical protein AUJ87_00180 [Candidatus Gracilibacteria bacterium CG1_02_38_174]PIQ11767.1 MAG: hypothetical protein COW68_01950 [Candidatus Gracilibacteria bacterium CG18_big_fil_WC_8_21_14_2_50_38_16]PIQ42135.1 MAG: hypothetical protein COW06_00735 [Candidatus Gracilibacteria bacterium CG12_big_fil_rev_8_21_14_0_65_38_15]PIZ01401.1 MAG: hypothetical protein COY60_03790 [Candidatus Gracilibacteria bacterium CG_4
MKKFLFIFMILAGSGILILLSFSKETPDQEENVVNIDFSEGEKLYGWNPDKKSFEKINTEGNVLKNTDTLYRHNFSPIDSIYYISADAKPFIVEKKGDKNIVTFGSGIFVCTIQTGLDAYEFHLKDITLIPGGKGSFFVDTTRTQSEIFSFDTFLSTELVSGTKRTPIASFILFPSLLFKHDPRNTLGLKDADLLRISIIDSIRYVDIKTSTNSLSFPGDNTLKNSVFVSRVQKDITARIHALVDLYNSFFEENNKTIQSTSFFDTSNTLLINGSKKEILLKNMLIENIKQLLYNSKNIQAQNNINDAIAEMKNLNPKVYTDGLAILKQYYYVVSFAHFVSKNDLFDFAGQESPILSLTEKIITSRPLSQQGEYYTHFSDLFSVYYFLDFDTENLNKYFEDILQKILDNKVLKENEFLPFVFFVTQYLSNGPVIPNEDTMNIVLHLFQITNDYYTYNKSNGAKITTITSTTFYNYTKIFAKLHNIFLNTFVDKTPTGLLFKKEYIDGKSTVFEQGFKDAFLQVINRINTDAEEKKNLLNSNESFRPSSQLIDSYTLLKNTIKSFEIFVSMFNNYSKYLNDFHLNESNRSAKGILVEEEIKMSKEILTTYLQKFNNLDISSITVTNNFREDGFYETQVTILGNVFHFNLYEQDHILTDISFTDGSGQKHSFPNISIPLDQKEEQLKDLFDGVDNPSLKYKYDFRNFFETTFLKGDSTNTTNPPETTPSPINTSSASPEIQLFIQKELLDKDFKNIESFLSIGFKNIDASISSDGNYVIDLHDIAKTFSINGTVFSTEFNSKYTFNRHAFSRLLSKVKKEGGEAGSYEFNGISIEILPARMSLLSLPDNLKDLGYYLRTIKQFYTNQQSIIIDLTGKRVLLDDIVFVPDFTTP